MTNQLEEELSPEIITLLQSDNDGIRFMFRPNTLVGGMERDGNPFIFGSDLTLPCSVPQLAEWLLSQRSLLESNSWVGRNTMLNWLNGIMHSKLLAGAIKKAEEEYAALRRERFLGFYSIPDDCDDWAGKPTLVADDAIPLMNGLDPKSWRNRENRHLDRESPLPDDMVDAITRGLKIAESDGFIAKSPAEWLVWGRRHGLDKQIMKPDSELRKPGICMWSLFAQAVAEVVRREQEDKQGSGERNFNKEYGANPSAEIYPVWQKRLSEIAEEMKQKDPLRRYPTKGKAAKILAEEIGADRINVERHTRKTWKN